jgi:hypothetical protein
MRRHKGFGALELIFILVALLVIVWFAGPTITGFITKEVSYTEQPSLVVTTSGEYQWTPKEEGELLSLKVDGSLTNNGSARVYLESNNIRKLVFDSSRVTEGQNETAAAGIFNTTLTAITGFIQLNNAPVYTGPASFEVKGKTNINLNQLFEDAEKDKLEFSAPSPLNLNLEIKNNLLTVTPDEGFVGERTAFISASDGATTTTQAVTLIVVQDTKGKGEDSEGNETEEPVEPVTNETITWPVNETANITEPIDNITVPMNETQNITLPLNETLNLTLPINETINITLPVNETNITTINQTTKTITNNLAYGSNPLYDVNNDGVETVQGVIDFDISQSTVDFEADASKLCARWEVYSEETQQATQLCYGSEECCAFVDLASSSEEWDSPYYSTYNKHGATENNIISSQIIYYDVNLSVENLKSDIVYSEWKNLTAKYASSYVEFSNQCLETCSLTGFNKTSYTLIFEIEGEVVLKIDALEYTVQQDVENTAPVVIANISNFTVMKNRLVEVNLSNHFADADGDSLFFSYFKPDNMSIEFNGSMATIIPDKGFVGTRYTYIAASDGSSSVSTAVFKIMVNDTEQLTKRIEVGKPVLWVERVSIENATSNNFNIPLPLGALNLTLYAVTNDSLVLLDADATIKVKGKDKPIDEYRKEKRLEKLERKLSLLEDAKSKGASRIVVDEENVSKEEIDEEKIETEAEKLDAERQLSDGTSDEYQGVTIKLNALPADTKEIELLYTTEAPALIEYSKENGKELLITSETSYTNVFVSTTIVNTPRDNVKLYWTTNNTKIEFSPIDLIDSDVDGLIDVVEWYVPHLSNQTFEIVTDTSTQWDEGTFVNMVTKGSGAAANLTSSGRNESGSYASKVFDAGSTATWKNITWSTPVPYGDEIGRVPGENNSASIESGLVNTSGLVLLMHFNNETGENDSLIRDFSPDINTERAGETRSNGTALNGAHYNLTNKKLGAGALEFDGSDDFLNASDSSNLDIVGQVTVSSWVYLDQIDRIQLFVTKRTGTTTNYQLWTEADNKLYFGHNDGAWTTPSSDGTLSANRWTHVATTYDDAANEVKFYINGVLDSTKSDTASIVSNTGALYIGRDGNVGTNYFDGLIDEVAIWNRSLSAQEIKNLYMRGAHRLNLSVRSCDDVACSGESWMNMGSNGTFGRVLSLSVADNRYFQYNFTYARNDSYYNDTIVNNVSINYVYYVLANITNLTILSSSGNNLTTDNITFEYVYLNHTDGMDHSYWQWYINDEKANGTNGVYTGVHWDSFANGNEDPYGITYANGYFWMVDWVDGKAYKYTSNGTYTGTSWNTATGNQIGITFANGYFWATDIVTLRVYQYTSNGTYTGSFWSTSASGNGDPWGIAFADGYFWVSDVVDDRIYQYTSNGTYTGSFWSTSASGNGDPYGIAFADGHFWVVDTADDEVYKYTSNGTYTGMSWDTAGSGNGDPQGITFANGYFWVSDPVDDEVYQYRAEFINSSQTRGGDRIKVEITPSDGVYNGTPVNSSVMTIIASVTNCTRLDTAEVYTLLNNISTPVPSNAPCFNITANSVTLDCQGNFVNGSDDGYGVYAEKVEGITIKNCSFWNWGNAGTEAGIYFTQVGNSTIKDANASTNNNGIYFNSNSNYNNVSKVQADSNTNYGIFLISNSSFNRVSLSTTNTNFDGTYVYGGSSNNTFINVTSNSNGQRGFVVQTNANGNTFINITANFNSQSGLVIDTSSSTTISGITANTNQYGLYVFTQPNLTTVTDGTLNSNSLYGVIFNGKSTPSSFSRITLFNNTQRNLYVGGNSSTFSHITASKTQYGVYLLATSSNNTFANLTIYNSSIYGFYFEQSSLNALYNSTFDNNTQYDIFLSESSDIHCNNLLHNVTTSYGRAIEWYNYSVKIENRSLSHLILCNADSSNLTNVTIDGDPNVDNNALLVWRTSNTVFRTINSSDNYYGLYLSGSHSNNLSHIIANSNGVDGIAFISSSSNNITNVTANANTNQGVLVQTGSNNTLNAITANLNTYGLVLSGSSSNNILSGITANSSSLYGLYLTSSNSNRIINASIQGGQYGTYILNSGNNSITNLYSFNHSITGIHMDSNPGNTTIFNALIGNATTGILLDGTQNDLSFITINATYTSAIDINDGAVNATIRNAIIAGCVNPQIGGLNNSAGAVELNYNYIANYSCLLGNISKIYNNYSLSDYPFEKRATNGGFYLNQSLAVKDGGDRTAIAAISPDGSVNLSRYYTTGSADAGTVDLGYHYPVAAEGLPNDICDDGTNTTTCYVYSTKSISAGSIKQFNILIVQNGGALGSSGIFKINATSITIESGGKINASVNITSTNLTIQNGSVIDASGRGFAGGSSGTGSGPGGGTAGDGCDASGGGGGGGGSYGGVGGTGTGGTSQGVGGPSYGSFTLPRELGSGGGPAKDCGFVDGGSGGGLVFINVTALQLDGSVLVNGSRGAASGAAGGAGGSGGSVLIISSNFSGSGIINASGGNKAASRSGGGGGGRIAIYYNNRETWNGTITAAGGTGANNGGQGTTYLTNLNALSNVSLTGGVLILNNNESYNVLNLTSVTAIINSSVTINYTYATYGSFEIRKGNVSSPNSIIFTNSSLIIGSRHNVSILPPSLINTTVYIGSNAIFNPQGTLTIDGTFLNNSGTISTPLLILQNTLKVNGSLNVGALNITASSAITTSNININATKMAMEAGSSLSGDNMSFTLSSFSMLERSYVIGSIVNISSTNLTIQNGSVIDASGRGFAGGSSGTGSGPGGGTAGDGCDASGGGGGGGGSYGGVGGTGTGGTSQGVGGPSYGSFTLPRELGSGGGPAKDCGFVDGGSGGGLVFINVTALQLDGSVLVNGSRGAASGAAGGAGGSGGSVLIISSNFSGSGIINASGGNKAASRSGGGGGGRIAIYYNNRETWNGTITAAGGSGAYNGGNGTFLNTSRTNISITINASSISNAPTIIRIIGQLNVTNYTIGNHSIDLWLDGARLYYNESTGMLTNRTTPNGTITDTNGLYNYTMNLSSLAVGQHSLKANGTFLIVSGSINTSFSVSSSTTYSNFNGRTTNFDNEADPSNVCNAVLDKQFNSTIEFKGCINVLNANFNSNVRLGSNSIFVNISGLNPSMNISANLTFANVTWVLPSIRVDYNDDGSYERCTDCVVLKYDRTGDVYNVTFNVSHFTSFISSETTNLSVWSQADSEGGRKPFSFNFSGMFFANYSLADSTPIANTTGNCTFSHNATGSFSTPEIMRFNISYNNLYHYNYTPNVTGFIVYNISCYSYTANVDNLSLRDNFTVSRLFVSAAFNATRFFYDTPIVISGKINLSNGTNASYTLANVYLNGTLLSTGNFTDTSDSDFSQGNSTNLLIVGAGVDANLTLLINNSQFTNDSYTALLLHFNGTHGSTSFYDDGNTTKNVTAKGNAQIVTTVFKLNGSAGYFDGSGDYLNISDDPSWSFGGGDFTLETWIYFNSAPGGAFGLAVYAQDDGTAVFAPVTFVISPSMRINVWASTTGSSWDVLNQQDFGDASSQLSFGKWHHLALVRSGNSWLVFIDGSQFGSTVTASGTLFDSSRTVNIGGSFQAVSGSGGLNGYLDEYRVSTGIARYTTNFTLVGHYAKSGNFTSRTFDAGYLTNWSVSWSAPEIEKKEIGRGTYDSNNATLPYINTSGLVLLLHFNNESGENNSLIKDFSVQFNGERNGETENNATCVTSPCPAYNESIVKFGGKSMGFDPDVMRLRVLDSPHWNLSNRSFAFSYWIYPFNAGGLQIILDKRSGAVFENWAIDSRFVARFTDGSQMWDNSDQLSLGYTANEWQYIVITRRNGTFFSYRNGVQTDSFQTTKMIESIPRNLSFGAHAGGGEDFDGFLDEFAIWNRSLSVDEINTLYNRGFLLVPNISIRSSNDSNTWSQWSTPNQSITSINNTFARYVQYKAIFATEDANQTPILNNVTLSYNGVLTNAYGNYNYTFTVAQDGSYEVKVNSTYQGVVGEKTLGMTVYTPTLRIQVMTLNDSYGADMQVNLTDPPGLFVGNYEQSVSDVKYSAPDHGGINREVGNEKLTPLKVTMKSASGILPLHLVALSVMLSILLAITVYWSTSGAGKTAPLASLVFMLLLSASLILAFSGTTGDYKLVVGNVPLASEHNVNASDYNLSFQLVDEPIGRRNQSDLNLTLGFPAFPGDVFLPTSSAFDESTDFAAEPNINNVCNARIVKTNFGKIEWKNCINAEGQDFDTNIKFSQKKFVKVASENLHSTINTAANITFYDVQGIRYPLILKDDVECSDCTILSWNSSTGIVVFNVTGFSNYTASEANQSKVVNYGSKNFSFYLLLKVQFYQNETATWVDSNVLEDDADPRNISNNSLIKLDTIFNGRWYTSDNATYGPGIYRVYAAARDASSNIINNTNGQLVEASYNFTVTGIPLKITNCTTLNRSITYALTRNISTAVPPNGVCFNITANGVTLDCQGNFVNGSDDGFGVYASNVQGITIKNCSFFRWGNANPESGIYWSNVGNSTIKAVNASKNNIGIYILSSSQNNFTDFRTDDTTNNQWGFYHESSSSNIFLRGYANTNYEGLYLNGGSSNTVINFTATGHTNYGLNVAGSSTVIVNVTANSNLGGIAISTNANNLSFSTATSNSWYGIYISGNSNTLSNFTIDSTSTYDGVTIAGTSNTLFNFTITKSNRYGLAITGGSPNSITSAVIHNSTAQDIYLAVSADSHCNIVFQNITSSYGRPIEWYNYSVKLENRTLAQLILCNADGSNLTNITIDSETTKDNNGLFVYRTSNATLRQINSSDNYYGLYVDSSSSNTFVNLTVSSNSQSGVYATSATSNSFHKVTSNFNGLHGIYLTGSSSNNLTSTTTFSDTSGVFLDSSSTNNRLNGVNSSSNTNGILLQSNSDSNTIINSTLNSNSRGVYLVSSSRNNITNTVVWNATTEGISLGTNPSNNTFFNTLISNATTGILLDGKENTFTFLTINATYTSAINTNDGAVNATVLNTIISGCVNPQIGGLNNSAGAVELKFNYIANYSCLLGNVSGILNNYSLSTYPFDQRATNGGFYLNQSLATINGGDRNAVDAVAPDGSFSLEQYFTSNFEDGGIVDLGYHYPVAATGFTSSPTYSAVAGGVFAVKDRINRFIAVIDSLGNLNIKGAVYESSSSLPDTNDFVIQNATGQPVAFIVNPEGNLILKQILEQSQGSLSPTFNSFVIQNQTGQTVAYFNSTGSLRIVGTATENVVFE